MKVGSIKHFVEHDSTFAKEKKIKSMACVEFYLRIYLRLDSKS